MAKLNGTDYPQLPERFLYDMKVELGIDPSVPVGELPTVFEREFPQEITLTKNIRGLGFRTLAGPARVIATWAYPTPGGVVTVEAMVPEDVRSQMSGSERKGDDMVTAVYEATLPQVLAAFSAAWGVEP